MSAALREALRHHGGPLAEHASAGPNDRQVASGPPHKAASGPRAAGREAEYELLIEMILEGSRLHYGDPTVVRTDDRDLALLLGDQLYALGLSRLAALGDLDAIDELADVISLIAQAHAAGDADLAQAVWDAGAVAIGWGSTAAHRAAKDLVRCGAPGAAEALRAATTSDAE
jgi:hypothetical protein